MAQRQSHSSRAPLSERHRQLLAKLVEKSGESGAMAALDMPSRHTFARLLAGLSVTAGTRALVQQRLAAYEARAS